MPRRVPRLVVENGKATAVILDIDVYREMLERLEDLEDLRMLEDIRKRPLDLQSLEDFLAEQGSDV
ncbi:MAG: type II toxin-antitoxin system Phd/YefM family antitoxin [Bacillota bacterium]|nr:type II toxin-antitoxin system Phd/YefM family antitoxin [Bacillota bacterium]MDI7249506.1 type II toxin-antitoxin system Phd/YefM family antitoxin [Bacillota bacterium]